MATSSWPFAIFAALLVIIIAIRFALTEATPEEKQMALSLLVVGTVGATIFGLMIYFTN